MTTTGCTIRTVWAAVLILTAAAPAAGQADRSTEADEAAVLAVVQDLFDGMREKDEALLASVFHPEAELHSTRDDGQGRPALGQSPVPLFIENVLASGVYLDEVTFDEEVRIDGHMAMAWTPYNLFVDGEFQHCGVDLFSMVRTEDGWKIIELVDTRRTDGCDPERGR